jgi:multiple sugar transport system permease protein
VVGLALRYGLALVAVGVFLFPLYWLFTTALKTEEEILTYPPVWWPGSVTFDHFATLLTNGDIRAVLTSLVIAAAATALAVALGTTGAVAIARAGTGARIFAAWALASRMAPPVMIAFPFALLLGDFGRAADVALLVLVLAAFNAPYVLWMMRGYFRDIPAGLEEAALVAGLTREELPRQVLWPMARGGLLATSAFTFVLAWNELAFALVLGEDSVVTLPMQLAQFEHRPELWGRVAALGVVGTLPVLVALGLMHGRLARSLSLGFVRD